MIYSSSFDRSILSDVMFFFLGYPSVGTRMICEKDDPDNETDKSTTSEKVKNWWPSEGRVAELSWYNCSYYHG